VSAMACRTANGELGYSTRRHMLQPVRPEAVLPDKAFCLPPTSEVGHVPLDVRND
jgi:hypothetical protein